MEEKFNVYKFLNNQKQNGRISGMLKLKEFKLTYKCNYIYKFMRLDFDNDVITDIDPSQTI